MAVIEVYTTSRHQGFFLGSTFGQPNALRCHYCDWAVEEPDDRDARRIVLLHSDVDRILTRLLPEPDARRSQAMG